MYWKNFGLNSNYFDGLGTFYKHTQMAILPLEAFPTWKTKKNQSRLIDYGIIRSNEVPTYSNISLVLKNSGSEWSVWSLYLQDRYQQKVVTMVTGTGASPERPVQGKGIKLTVNYSIFTASKRRLEQGNNVTNFCQWHRGWARLGWLPSMHHRSHDTGDLHPVGPASKGGLSPVGSGGFCITLWLQTPPQDTWNTTGYDQQAGGTHTTGMLSCRKINLNLTVN